MGPVRQALQDSGLSINEINKVLMVGGSSRIPAVQEVSLRTLLKRPPASTLMSVLALAPPFRPVFWAEKWKACRR